MNFGIDVSSHNGKLDWDALKSKIDFAMLRIGYGKNNIDKQFKVNADACARLGIPFGGYWFSYALDANMAEKEAEYALAACSGYHLDYPIAYDFEYDSHAYAEKMGITIDAGLMRIMAERFLNKVRDNTGACLLYANPDYLNKGFKPLVGKYDLWLAYWGDGPTTVADFTMWQSTSKGELSGIKGRFDFNYCTVDYPSLLGKEQNDGLLYTDERLINIMDKISTKYIQLAGEVIKGRWGNGEERKRKAQAAGYDYELLQAIVNWLVNG